jgi:hypothetical protein
MHWFACSYQIRPTDKLTCRRQRALMGLLVNAMRNETVVDPSRITEEIEGLRHLSTAQLKGKYREVFGEDSRSNHK